MKRRSEKRIRGDLVQIRFTKDEKIFVASMAERAGLTLGSYSQESFADKCGVHRTFMGTIERGESNLSFQNIAKVATTLGVSLSTLFLDLENRAQVLAGRPSGNVAVKPKKRSTATKRHP